MIGIEICPPESRLVDVVNNYYLWVFERLPIPFMFMERIVSEAAPLGCRQRP
jgi:hypothetical protein